MELSKICYPIILKVALHMQNGWNQKFQVCLSIIFHVQVHGSLRDTVVTMMSTRMILMWATSENMCVVKPYLLKLNLFRMRKNKVLPDWNFITKLNNLDILRWVSLSQLFKSCHAQYFMCCISWYGARRNGVMYFCLVPLNLTVMEATYKAELNMKICHLLPFSGVYCIYKKGDQVLIGIFVSHLYLLGNK